jgi:hypothetical protein
LGIACVVAATGLLGLLAVRGSELRNLRRVVRSTARVAIADLDDHADGERLAVGVVGAIGSRTLVAPFAGVTCLAYHIRLRYRVDDSTVKQIEVAVGLEFTIDDGTGVAHVIGDGFQTALTPHPGTVRVRQLPPPLFDRLRSEARSIGDDANVEFEESAVLPGQRIAVLGRPSRLAGRMAFAAGPETRLVLCDDVRVCKVTLPVAMVRPPAG